MARYGTQQVPFSEGMLPKPQDPYGIAKYAAEMMVTNLSEVHNMNMLLQFLIISLDQDKNMMIHIEMLQV